MQLQKSIYDCLRLIKTIFSKLRMSLIELKALESFNCLNYNFLIIGLFLVYYDGFNDKNSFSDVLFKHLETRINLSEDCLDFSA